jgi:imidazole glycerol-phosphate synthase subunit HisH
MLKIAIIDYGLGNLRSVSRGLEKAGANAIITSDKEEIAAADGLVLPGVGAFHEGMDQLGPLKEIVISSTRDVPLLGICLGTVSPGIRTKSSSYGLEHSKDRTG